MMTVDQLLILARDYQWATKIGLIDLSLRCCGNEKTIGRLRNGLGANTKTIDRAARWFVANWPNEVPWPKSVPHPDQMEINL